MYFRILLLMIVLPATELYVLARSSDMFGIGPTVGLVIATGIAGAALARAQGFEVLRQLQAQMNQGQLPAGSVLEGVLVLLGGVLLLTPGFITDLCGFLLLLPWTRAPLRRYLEHWIGQRVAQGQIRIHRL